MAEYPAIKKPIHRAYAGRLNTVAQTKKSIATINKNGFSFIKKDGV